MARQERPVDSTAGPLQSFAYDLRKVRAEAGNPALGVVLTYVGACPGDVETWRREILDRKCSRRDAGTTGRCRSRSRSRSRATPARQRT